MKYRKFGKTGINVPVVSFGAWAIGGLHWGGTDDEKAIRAIRKAIDLGVNCIDTAPVYGFGHSEEIVGKAIKGRRDEVIIATKCGLIWERNEGEFFFEAYFKGKHYRVYRNLRKDSIIQECEKSLKRLDVDVIDIYQCHWPDRTTPIDETMEALEILKSQGKIKVFGVSNFDLKLMKDSLKYARIESNQVRYNLLNREIENDIIPFCIENNIAILAYSPLEHGILSGKVTMERKFPDDDIRSKHHWFQLENRRRVLEALDKIKPIAYGYGVTIAQLVINWTFSQPGITTAIVGARNPEQVEENAGSASFELSEDDRGKIAEIFSELKN
jgi:aryl-alcohol dehydrogenase-like predicted oxidoreductase